MYYHNVEDVRIEDYFDKNFFEEDFYDLRIMMLFFENKAELSFFNFYKIYQVANREDLKKFKKSIDK